MNDILPQMAATTLRQVVDQIQEIPNELSEEIKQMISRTLAEPSNDNLDSLLGLVDMDDRIHSMFYTLIYDLKKVHNDVKLSNQLSEIRIAEIDLIANEIVEQVVRIASISTPIDNVRHITISPHGLKASRFSFHNFDLNMSQVMMLAGSSLTTAYGALEKPHWMIVIGGLLMIVGSLLQSMERPLTEDQASVFWGFMKASEKREWIATEEEIRVATNFERDKIKREPIDDRTVQAILIELQMIKIIKEISPKKWKIVESHNIK